MRIKSHARLIYVAMAAAGLVTLGVMGAYIHLMRQDGRDGWFFYAFVAPFVLVGAFLVVYGGRVLARMARLGTWQLEVPEGGGVFGHPFDVTLFPSRARTPSGELTCRLRCMRIVMMPGMRSTSGRSEVTTVWETTWTTRAGTLHPSIGLPLRLPLPATGQPSSVDGRTGAGVHWQLNVVVPAAQTSDESVFDLQVRQ